MDFPRRGIISGGNLIMDYIKIVDVWPSEGMLANIEFIEKNPGGAVYNVLTDIAKMGKNIPLYSMGLIGEDSAGDEIIELLRRNGINTKFVFRTKKAKTSYTDVMTVKSNGRRTFFHYRGANCFLNENHFSSIETDAKIFHLGYLLLLDSLDLPEKKYGTVAAKVLAMLQKKGYKTSVDVVSEDSDRYTSVVIPCLKHIDYFIINEVEAQKITGLNIRKNNTIDQNELEKAAKKIIQLGVNSVVVIHFPEGGIAVDKNKKITFTGSFKIVNTEIKGSVGAGDAFCAGVLYGLHEGLEMEETLKIGHASAYFNLKNPTSTGGAVSMKNIKEFLSKNPEQNDLRIH